MVVVVQLVVVSRKPSIYGPRCVVVSMEFGSRKQESWNSSFHLAKHEETRTGTRLGYDGCCGSLFGTKARQRHCRRSQYGIAQPVALWLFSYVSTQRPSLHSVSSSSGGTSVLLPYRPFLAPPLPSYFGKQAHEKATKTDHQDLHKVSTATTATLSRQFQVDCTPKGRGFQCIFGEVSSQSLFCPLVALWLAVLLRTSPTNERN